MSAFHRLTGKENQLESSYASVCFRKVKGFSPIRFSQTTVSINPILQGLQF